MCLSLYHHHYHYSSSSSSSYSKNSTFYLANSTTAPKDPFTASYFEDDAVVEDCVSYPFDFSFFLSLITI